MHGFPNDPGDYVTALNDANQIAGYYDAPVPPNGAYFGDLVKEVFIWLQPLGGNYPNSKAYGINKLGQIVGSCSNSQNTVSVACVWTDPAKAPTVLSPLPGYTSGYANAINDNGLIVGRSYNNATSQHACKWTLTAPDQPVDLGALGGAASTASGVNNAGQIVGWAFNTQGKQRACLWNPGQPAQDLAASLPDGCTAQFINNQGNVLGDNPFTGLGYGNAFYWNHQTGAVQVVADNYDSYPVGLTDANLVLARGESIMGGLPFFIWTPGDGGQDLNKMIVNLPPGVTVTKVTLISPKGNILGVHSGGNSCLVTPIVALPGNNLLLLD
jgi:probable HAF family extracellular repeat protein